LDFPPFRHVNWILDLPSPRYDLATSNVLPDWNGHLETPDPMALMRKGDPSGDRELRSLIARDLDMDMDRIVLTNGTSEANHLAFLCTIGPGTRVLIERPIYAPLLEVPRALGAEISFIKRRPDEFRIDIRELKAKLEEGADLLVLQNHNNPSGRVLQGHELKDIVRTCSEYGTPILCDEVYRDFALSPGEDGRLVNPIPSMARIYDKGITTSSVTKVYGATGLATGWLAGPKRLVARARRIKIMIDPMVSHFGNRMALSILNARDQVLPGTFEDLREKLRLVSQWAKGRSDVHWSHPHGCAVGFLRYDHDIGSIELCERLYKEKGTKVIPGAFFRSEGGFRIGLTAPYETIRGGLEMIDALMDEL